MREIICVGFFLGTGVEAAKGTVGAAGVVVELDMVGEVLCGRLCWDWDMGMGVTLVRM
jgi:hypothetical protein